MDYHVKGKSGVIDWLLHRSPTLLRRLDTLLLLISGKQPVVPQLTRPLESKIASKLGRLACDGCSKDIPDVRSSPERHLDQRIWDLFYLVGVEEETGLYTHYARRGAQVGSSRIVPCIIPRRDT